MKTILVDVYEHCVKPVDVPDKLDAFYKQLHCDTIDITERNIGGKQFSVMCDDEGLLKEEVIVSAFDSSFEPVLVGNLMFFHTDPNGHLVGLADDECQHLISCVEEYVDFERFSVYPVMTKCDYTY